MGKRENVTFNLSCKSASCNSIGVVIWSENENPYHHNGKFERKLESLVGDFKVSDKKDSAGDPEIICKNCLLPV